jgi:hypothetical protein
MSKGGRPSRPDRVEKNGNSLKVFLDGVYVGSITIRALGEYVKERGR